MLASYVYGCTAFLVTAGFIEQPQAFGDRNYRSRPNHGLPKDQWNRLRILC
jgi:hypothetical protein